MRERPNGADLLHAAQELMERELLPLLPASGKHAARMVLRAMGIAQRELAHGARPEQSELQRLAALLEAEACGDPAQARLALNRMLIQRIRDGRFDPGAEGREAALAHLKDVARMRLLESNPRVLGEASPHARQAQAAT